MASSRNVASGVLTTLLRRNYSQLTVISSRKSRECSYVPSRHPVAFISPAKPTAVATAASYATGDAASSGATTHHPDEIAVKTVNGFHQLSIPMVSRRISCWFTLQPYANTLADLCKSIREEDKAIQQVHAENEAGELIASSTNVDALFQHNFFIVINDKRYLVKVAKEDRLQRPDTSDNVRHLVASLYRTVNSEQYYQTKQRLLLARQEQIRLQLEPLEKIREELEKKAEKRTRHLQWIGLALMGTQFGFMARLTWWEYSWDVMEPVTYFVGYATAIAMFAYYVITRQEYLYPAARSREYLITMHRKAKQLNLDIDTYNRLHTQLFQVEMDLKRLRDPLDVGLSLPYLPPKPHDQNTSQP